jgi:hypothetical protein
MLKFLKSVVFQTDTSKIEFGIRQVPEPMVAGDAGFYAK